jgi:hypothetical protein
MEKRQRGVVAVVFARSAVRRAQAEGAMNISRDEATAIVEAHVPRGRWMGLTSDHFAHLALDGTRVYIPCKDAFILHDPALLDTGFEELAACPKCEHAQAIRDAQAANPPVPSPEFMTWLEESGMLDEEAP